MADLYKLNDPASGVDWQDFSTMKELTCVNHPTAEYLTKNPWQRSLHFIHPCVEAMSEPHPDWPLHGLECPCPFSDFRVVINSGKYKDTINGQEV